MSIKPIGRVDLLADAMQLGVQSVHEDMVRMEGLREDLSNMEGMQGQTVEQKKGPFV